MHHIPVLDDDPQYETSSYNHAPVLPDSVGFTWALLADDWVPHTYKDAMSHPDSDSWLEACMEELAALKETRTYIPECVDEVSPHNIVGCHWVFALKKGPDGEIEHYKACIIAKGFNQIYSIDYEETFAPVVKWVSI